MTPALTFSALSIKGPSAEPLCGEESGCHTPIVIIDGDTAVRFRMAIRDPGLAASTSPRGTCDGLMPVGTTRIGAPYRHPG
jgi:hypothetical protein